MSKTIKIILVISACVTTLYSCSAPAARVQVEQIFTNANCQHPPGLSELHSPDSLQRALASQRALSVPTNSPSIPDFDPATRYFLLSLGTKNSGGYGVRLEQNEAQIRDRTVWIDIVLQEPEPGMMTTQALTSPCMVFRVDRADYSRLAITGQEHWDLLLEPTGD